MIRGNPFTGIGDDDDRTVIVESGPHGNHAARRGMAKRIIEQVEKDTL